MPKVLRILNRLIIGGPLLNAAYLTKYLSPEFETLLVVGEKEFHEKDAGFITDALGIKPLYLPQMGRSINPMRDYSAFRRMKDIMRDFKPDIVHTHAAKPGAIGRMAASQLKVPVIVHTYHGHVFHSYFSSTKTKLILNAERYLAKRSDAIIAISNAQQKELTEKFNIAPADKFRIIPLGLDLEKFSNDYDTKRKKFRNEFKIEDDEIAIAIIGRLVPVKNHTLFLEGLQYVLNNTTRKVKAFIVGNGETRQALEAKAKELGILFTGEKNTNHPHPLIFTSWRGDVDVINAGVDIIALTSLNEGTPVSLIEAQAANNPIVSTSVGGISDVVLEGKSGLLSPLSDNQQFCNNLLELVNNDELRTSLSKQGNAFVKEQFSYQRLMKDMSSLYHELLANKK
ncbi:MAG: glycosyltransferase [Chitinophagaceae bacterium]